MEVWVEMCSESGVHWGSLKSSANKQKQKKSTRAVCGFVWFRCWSPSTRPQGRCGYAASRLPSPPHVTSSGAGLPVRRRQTGRTRDREREDSEQGSERQRRERVRARECEREETEREKTERVRERASERTLREERCATHKRRESTRAKFRV